MLNGTPFENDCFLSVVIPFNVHFMYVHIMRSNKKASEQAMVTWVKHCVHTGFTREQLVNNISQKKAGIWQAYGTDAIKLLTA